MPKLRDANTDLGKFSQWIGRKCKNHNPLHELGLDDRTRRGLTNTHRQMSGRGDVSYPEGRDDQIVYKAHGRTFLIEVKEVQEDQTEKAAEA